MSAPCIAVADAVVAELAGGSFSLGFEAGRKWLPQYDLDALDGTKIVVFPDSIQSAYETRASTADTYVINVVVLAKTASDEDVDSLVGLTHELADYFRFRRLAAYPDVSWFGAQIDPLVSADHLVNNRTFMSALSLTYRHRREK